MPANAVNCIKGEIHNVIASLRLGGESSIGLLQDFKALHDSLCAVSSRTAITEIDTLSYFEPFLALLQSGQTSGVVTHVALSAINKFILYGFLAPDAVQTAQVLNRTAAAASLVRFERIDRSIDEQVYLQICTTLLHCIICPAGKLLNDSAVWLCVKTCYDISTSDSLSPIVCRFAEDVLMQMVLCVFSHVSSMAGEEAGDVGTLKLRDRHLPLPTSLDGDHTPYNAQCVLYICRWLFSLVDPQQNEENHRVYGLGLVNVALETSGQMIGLIPPIVEMIGHDLCKYLLQNSQSNAVPILSLSLRVIFNLFNSSVKGNLKVQLEVFFNTIHLRIPALGNNNENGSTMSGDGEDEYVPYEKKELVLESLVEFCAEPELMVDLYCNYDLDLGSSNLFEKLTAFLAANMFSDTGHFNSLHRLCLEALLAVVESVEQMFCHPENSSYATLLQSNDGLDSGNDDLAKTKAEKKKLVQAADQWNKNKKKSLGTLASMGMIAAADDPVAIAKFFRNTPGLDLDSLGEYFGKISDKFHQSVFAEFVKTFNFEGFGLDMALRTFLESFRLPGEAQQVSTILEAFAARYYEHNEESAANADTIFVLSFSIIMLNTDLHNDGVKNKMTLEEFIRNNRGIDNGKDLPPEFLESIYTEILHNEIKMKPDAEKLSTEEMDDKQWEQLLRSGSNSQISSGTATLAVGRDMFALICTKVVSAMCMSLDTTSPIHNERMVYKVLTAFEHVVNIAAFFKQPDILNNAVVSLCKSLRRQTELLAGLIERAGPAAAFRDSTSKKALQIVQALFKIVHKNFSMLQDSWLNIIECVVLLNRGQLNLLPTDLTDVDDFYDASGKPLPSSVSQLAAAQHHRAGHGEEDLSFLSLFYPPEEEEIEQQRAADQEAEVAMRATVATCNISGIFVASKTLSADTLPHLVNALLKCTGSYAADASEGRNSSTGAGTGKVFSEELLSQIYCLEWLTNVCRHNQYRMDVLWPLVSSFFQSGLAAGASGTAGSTAGKHRLFLERIVVSILRLCCYFEESHVVSSPRGPRSPVDTLFATLRPICATLVPMSPQSGTDGDAVPPPTPALPDGVILALGSRVTAGLLMLLRSNSSMLREVASWEMVFDICQRYAGQPTSQQCALESLHYIITNHHELYVGPGARFMKVLLNVAGTASKASPTERSHTLVDSLMHMHETLASSLPQLATDKESAQVSNANASPVFLSEEEWAERWVQTLVWIATQCLDPRPDAHNYAATNLHQALFSATVPTPPVAVLRRTFDDILYRLLPEIVNHFRPVDDMRVKCFNLLSQFFLHNITVLRALPQDEFDEFLAGYIAFTRQYMCGNHETTVLDSICDILRNTMMVMSVEGLLASVPVWSEATALLEQFCPDLKHSLQPGGSPFAAAEAEAARLVAEAAATKLAAEQEAAAARLETEAARRSLEEMQSQHQAIAAQSQSLQQQHLRQEKLQQAGGSAAPVSPTRAFSVEELQGMKVSALQKLAAKHSIDEDTIDDAMEADKPKDALIELIVRLLPVTPAPQPVAERMRDGENGTAMTPPQANELLVSSASQAPIPPSGVEGSQPAGPMPPPPMPPPPMPPPPMPPPSTPPPAANTAETGPLERSEVSGTELSPSLPEAETSYGLATHEAEATQEAPVAAVAVEAFDVQFSSTPHTERELQVQPVAVATATAVEPEEESQQVGAKATATSEEEGQGVVYPTDWSGLCNTLCSEFPSVSRTDVIGAMGRNDNDGKRAARELRDLVANGEAGGEGPPIDDPEYAASHGL